jgi:NitT/TauT family transport system substrate-binding protein
LVCRDLDVGCDARARGAPAQEKLNLSLNGFHRDHSPYFYAGARLVPESRHRSRDQFGKGLGAVAQQAPASRVRRVRLGDVAGDESKGANLAVMIVYAVAASFYWLKSTGIAGPKDFLGEDRQPPATRRA